MASVTQAIVEFIGDLLKSSDLVSMQTATLIFFFIATTAAITIFVIMLLRLTAIALLALQITSNLMAQSPSSHNEKTRSTSEASQSIVTRIENWLKILMKYLL